MADRNIQQVIEQIQAQIPHTEEYLHMQLNALKKKIPYCPPECRKDLWFECAHLLDEAIGEPKHEWQKTVEAIFSKKEV